jgi:hypothetical protein
MTDKNQLAPGDLAIVIKSLDGLAMGKIVECISMDGEHTQYGKMWLCKFRTNVVSEYGAVGTKMHVPQDWLRKIPSDPLDEEDLYRATDELPV